MTISTKKGSKSGFGGSRPYSMVNMRQMPDNPNQDTVKTRSNLKKILANHSFLSGMRIGNDGKVYIENKK